MPWKASRAVDERLAFIVACQHEDESFAALCRRFGVSRKTGYKWTDRFEQFDAAGLDDRAPIANGSRRRVELEVADRIVEIRKQHPFWGPKKLRAILSGQPVAEGMPSKIPAASTIGEILKARGLIRPRRRRPQMPRMKGAPVIRGIAPNDVWCCDFKGHWMLRDRTRCGPFTLADEFSRYLFKLESLTSDKHDPVQAQFELAFREFGMPLALRHDSGTPFASLAPGGLSRLSVWLIRLDVCPLRTHPGEPQENGVQERMHRTLEQETKLPLAQDGREQQRRLDHFKHEFNDERPHEGLEMKTPRSAYSVSRRAFPDRLREPEYGDGIRVRKLDSKGGMKFSGKKISFSAVLANAEIGLREIEENRHEIFYGPIRVGVLEVRNGVPKFDRR
jgi:transposase InsO family protein